VEGGECAVSSDVSAKDGVRPPSAVT
jgi:hypothetical protein